MYKSKYSSIIPVQQINMENTYQIRQCEVTTRRSAHFHPTIGSVTPNGFTTSHPRARP
jgi:hypothetical protein